MEGAFDRTGELIVGILVLSVIAAFYWIYKIMKEANQNFKKFEERKPRVVRKSFHSDFSRSYTIETKNNEEI